MGQDDVTSVHGLHHHWGGGGWRQCTPHNTVATQFLVVTNDRSGDNFETTAVQCELCLIFICRFCCSAGPHCLSECIGCYNMHVSACTRS